MKKYYSKEDATYANTIDIVELLKNNGEIIKKSSKYYTTEKHDSLRIKGSSFVWYSRNLYGHTIEFVREFYNLSFYDAVDFILTRNPHTYIKTAEKTTNKCKENNLNFKKIEQLNENTDKKR